MLVGESDCLLAVSGGRLAEGRQVARHLEQDAGGLSGFRVAVNDAVDGVGSVAGDAEKGQGWAVEDGGVAGAVVEADGVGCGGGIEVVTGGVAFFG